MTVTAICHGTSSAAGTLFAAKLGRPNIYASAGSVEEIERIVGQIREARPRARIVLRGDCAFARDRSMAWCEDNRVDHVFGRAGAA